MLRRAVALNLTISLLCGYESLAHAQASPDAGGTAATTGDAGAGEPETVSPRPPSQADSRANSDLSGRLAGELRSDSEATTGAAAPKVPTVPLDGVVLNKGDRIPLASVSVLIVAGEEQVARATTDDVGRFHFEAVPVGAYLIKLRAPQVTGADVKIELKAQKRLELTLYVAGKTRYSSTVRGQRVVVETVEHNLSSDEIKHIPGTQGDTLKSVQSLPGVARAPFGGGQLVVWGSSPNDTRVYVDGVFIPTLYHFGGLRSTVNSEIVSGLSFLPGGYGVDHGRGLGGVVEVETRRPKDKGYHGFVQLDLIDGSLLVEGPITKNLSLSLSARRSWIDVFLPLFTTSDFTASPRYWDYQARLHYTPTKSDDLDLFIFGSDDVLTLVSKSPNPNLDASVDSHTYYHRLLLKYVHRFKRRVTLTVTPSIGYDVPFQVNATLGNTPFHIDAETFAYGLRTVVRAPITSWLRLDGGIDFEGNRVTLSASAPTNGPPREGDNPGQGTRTSAGFTTDALTLYQNNVAPFAMATFALFDKRLTVTPQFRLEVLTFTGYRGTPQEYSHAYALPEPRLSLRYQIKKWVAVKAALGVYHQAPDPASLTRGFGNPDVHPTVGIHYVAGVELQPMPSLHIDLEGFYKDLRQLIVRGEYPGDPTLQNDGVGRVYGLELLVRQELWKNFFGWISYTLSRSERREHPDQPWRVFQFDQTHILTLLASYKLPRGYQVGLRFRVVTGNPVTPAIGSYFDANTGGYTAIYGTPYSARLDTFHQLDLRFDKTWTLNRFSISAYIDIQNLYNARAPEGLAYNFDYTQKDVVAGLPFLPVLGLRGDF
jgi:hypothetical protein